MVPNRAKPHIYFINQILQSHSLSHRCGSYVLLALYGKKLEDHKKVQRTKTWSFIPKSSICLD